MSDIPRFIKDPNQLSKPLSRDKQYVFKCRVTGQEYITLGKSEDSAFYRGPAKMGWERIPDSSVELEDPKNPLSPPKDPRLLKYKYYAQGFGPGMQLKIVNRMPKGLK